MKFLVLEPAEMGQLLSGHLASKQDFLYAVGDRGQVQESFLFQQGYRTHAERGKKKKKGGCDEVGWRMKL